MPCSASRKHRRHSVNYFRNSFLARVWHVRSKETARLEAVDGGAGRFLRRHPTRVSCVFIRGVGSPWNENGAPGGVRRELVFPAHFSRERPPENRLSPRGPTTVSRTILHVSYFGKSPISIKPRRERWAADGEPPVLPVANTKAGYPRYGTSRLFTWRRWGRREGERRCGRREKICDLGDSYICHCYECLLSGARKSEKISVLASSEIAVPFGTNGSGEALDLPLYAK